MIRGVFSDRPEHLLIDECTERELKENEVRIKSEFSAIKHGTDFNILSGKSPFATKDFDGRLRMFVDKPVVEEQKAFKRPFGNTTVGTVLEVGSKVTRFKAGDRVYAFGQIAEEIIAEEHWTEELIEPMTPLDAVCMDPATYAYAAVRDANVKVGDNVVVSGLGAIGMFVVQLLKLSGCMEVIAIDPMKKRREQALKLGASLALDPTSCDVAMEVHRYLDKGADTVIEASGNYIALYQAMKTVQQCGTIVTLGYYKGKDTELVLGEEWHHNRLTMKSSMPVWNNALRDYPTWNYDRLLKTLKQMFMRKMLVSEGIVDPIVEFDDCVEAVMNIYKDPSQSIKLGVMYKK